MRGKWVLFCWIGFLHAYPELILRIVDQQGATIDKVFQGEPFVVCVTVVGDNNANEPRIEHREKCAIFERRPVMTTISIVNGKQSSFKKYTYTARIDALGAYALGPAVLEIGNQRIQSNAITFQVAKREGEKPVVGDTNKPLLLASVNKRELYVGEQIILTVRLCYGPSVKQVSLEPFTLSELCVQPLDGPRQEPYTYAGKQWQSVVYRFAIMARTAGQRLIARIVAHCAVEQEDASFFSHFFGGALQTVSVYTTPIELLVKSLPTAQPVDGVGQFSHFQLTADHAQLSATKGATVALRVTGDGCMPTMLTKPLQGVPSELLCYDSTTALSPAGRDGFFTKKREWVIQGIQPGVYTIPAQTITVFDPVRVRYGTLHTQPLVLTVAAEMNKNKPFVEEIDGFVMKPLVWWLFVLLAVIPVAGTLGAYGWYWYMRAPAHITYAYIKRGVLQASKKNDAMMLYHVLRCMSAEKLAVPVSAITTQNVIDFAQKMFNNEQLTDQWRTFVRAVEQAAFSSDDVRETAVFAEAKLWLEHIKEWW